MPKDSLHNIKLIAKKTLFPLQMIIMAAWLLSTSQAHAESSSYEIQYLLLDSKTRGATYQTSGLLYKHNVPYNKIIDLEGIVALGITEDSTRRKSGIAGNYTQKQMLSNMLGVLLKISGEIEPKVHGYVHFGLARIELDLSTPSWVGVPDSTPSATGLTYGLGISLKVLSKGAFVVEYNQLPDVDVGNDSFENSVIAVGYQMPF